MIVYYVLILLSSNAASLRRDKSILFSRNTIVNLLYCSFLALNILILTSFDTGIGLYGGSFNVTSITHVFHIFIFLISALILQLTAFYPRKIWIKDMINKMGQQFNIVEYPLILLFIISGSIFLISTSDIVSIFLSIELQSYGLYLLSTLYRDSELSTSAGLTYFLLGGLSSCFILLGTSLLYTNTGLTNLDGFYVITNLFKIENNYLNLKDIIYLDRDLNISLIIMSVGFLFKISAAPFHFWSPDVYDAIPTIITTFVAIISKISILIFLFQLVHYTSNFLLSSKYSWTLSLLFSSFLSLIVGTILGLTQFRIKKLFAYSTISHLGFILLALSINSIESIQAFIFYLSQYTISNLNAFILLIVIGITLYPYVNDGALKKHYLLDKINSPIQLISQIKGYFYINPFLALSLAITLFSLVGIPPLIGFFAKQMVLSAALDSGYYITSIIAILTSVVSAVYYLNIIKQIFFVKPEYKLNPIFKNISFNINNHNLYSISRPLDLSEYKVNIYNVVLSSFLTITISTITFILLLFILTPQEWLSIAATAALIMFNL
uniref:NADH-ubiquinone oxidoreductase chain 2 n=1 Tax=Coccocarpia palmicola TaxID=301477 RepID=A0A1V0FWI1_9LECA|nr:NADH dehydrogenase subunit 2 [Coccocarpia palmicola]ARB49954.1 NADH dehydrogenase subunit 2 [Coccocarpia palmicola]